MFYLSLLEIIKFYLSLLENGRKFDVKTHIMSNQPKNFFSECILKCPHMI